MTFNNLIVEKSGKFSVIKINRPDKLNALNVETMNELHEVFTGIKNDPEVSAVIITGAGDKAFVAGADISELNKLNMISGKEFSEKGQEIFNLIENCGKPVIAAINGFALGGGCELALACHIRLASENARLGQPEVNLGIIPGYGGTQRLSRLINPGRAAECILTGDIINAQEALRIGLVNHIYPQSELLNKAMELAEKISEKPQHAVSAALMAIHSSVEGPLRQGLNIEAGLFASCIGTDDFKEGTSAFLEKRTAVFKGS